MLISLHFNRYAKDLINTSLNGIFTTLKAWNSTVLLIIVITLILNHQVISLDIQTSFDTQIIYNMAALGMTIRHPKFDRNLSTQHNDPNDNDNNITNKFIQPSLALVPISPVVDCPIVINSRVNKYGKFNGHGDLPASSRLLTVPINYYSYDNTDWITEEVYSDLLKQMGPAKDSEKGKMINKNFNIPLIKSTGSIFIQGIVNNTKYVIELQYSSDGFYKQYKVMALEGPDNTDIHTFHKYCLFGGDPKTAMKINETINIIRYNYSSFDSV